MRGVWNSGPVTDAPPTGPTSIAVAPATDPDTGLTSAEVAERTSRGQVNATEQATSRPLWTIIKSNVFTRFNALLGVLVELRAGDQVPADGHLHSVSGLEVDESNLTGESDPMPKQPDDDVRSGTTVVAGSGRFVAAAVGADSYVNTIAAQAKTLRRPTPRSRRRST